MKSLLRRSLGLGAMLTLLAGPALAENFYYSSYPNHAWQREHQAAVWRAHERHEAWWHAHHGYGYAYHPGRWGY